MQNKIILEEHFATQEVVDSVRGAWSPFEWKLLRARLLDIHDERLREMDAAGIEMMLLSLVGPSVQGVADPHAARELAMRSNDYLAEQIAKRPDRFQGFAALPMQDPQFAAEELARCINALGFKGALVNSFSQAGDGSEPLYYDLPQYRPFWAEVERLDVPFYLHPRNLLSRDTAIFEGHPWMLGPVWAFGHETAVHALRLMGSGLFDAHPGLKIVLGHLGEALPFLLWRIDNQNNWMERPNPYPAKRQITDYFRENFYITTSGNFSDSALHQSLQELGADRVLFSVDWPFASIRDASNWFDGLDLPEADRRKIARDNAVALFGIS